MDGFIRNQTQAAVLSSLINRFSDRFCLEKLSHPRALCARDIPSETEQLGKARKDRGDVGHCSMMSKNGRVLEHGAIRAFSTGRSRSDRRSALRS